jgi:hypothetical protein
MDKQRRFDTAGKLPRPERTGSGLTIADAPSRIRSARAGCL